MNKEVVVLRYGHRYHRDLRVTSHCCLVARAFGAKKIIIQGDEDKSLRESVDSVSKNWGAGFELEFRSTWRKVLIEYKKKGFKIVHLTMYGESINKIENEFKKINKILVIIGSQKVERDVYFESDYNVSITTQPHSEIAALAVCLDRIFERKEIEKKFKNAKIRIIGSAKGEKKIIRT